MAEEVAVYASAVPAEFEYSRELAVKEVTPVPPPPTVSVPESVGLKVKAPAELVMLSPCVCPKDVTEVVAKVMAPV